MLAFCRGEEKPDVQIVVPHAELERLQKERDKEIKSVFEDVDARRKEVDERFGKIPSPSPKKNVTAKELEEKLK